MRTDIFMVSFRRDLEFATYSLRSIAKYCTGFGAVKIMVPVQDVDAFREVATPLGFNVLGFHETEGKGMLHHQALICSADWYCPKADYILHVDSDCLFWAPTTPADFFVNGKPVLYREKFEEFRERHPLRYGWKKAVFDATGLDPEYETMVRHPAIHSAEVYSLTRQRIGINTGKDWKEYILSGPNEFPQQFAEFPTLGAVAMHTLTDEYHWVDQSNGGLDYVYEKPRDKMIAFWSHGGVAPYMSQINEILS